MNDEKNKDQNERPVVPEPEQHHVPGESPDVAPQQQPPPDPPQSIIAPNWRPLPPFRTAESRSFSFELTDYIIEGRGIGVGTPLAGILVIAHQAPWNFTNPLLAPLGFERAVRAVAAASNAIPGEVINKADPTVRNYTPPEVTFSTRLEPGTLGTNERENRAIANGARFFLEGTAPDILYSSEYVFRIVSYTDPGATIRFFGWAIATAVVDIVGTPVWESIPLHSFSEGQTPQIDVKPYVKNEVDEWRVTSPATGPPMSQDPNAPTFPLQITNGVVTSSRAVPSSLDHNINYSYTVTARNAVDETVVQRERVQMADQTGQFRIVEAPPEFQKDPHTIELEESADRQNVTIADVTQFMINVQNNPADGFTVQVTSSHPATAPPIHLGINNQGSLILIGGPPLIDTDVQYWVTVTGRNDGGTGTYVFHISVKAAIPIWGALPDRENDERETIDFTLDSSHIINYAVSNSVTDPIRYRIRTSNPARFQLNARRDAMGGVRINGTAPAVQTQTDFTVTVQATNLAHLPLWASASYTHTIHPRPGGVGGGNLPVRWKVSKIPDQFMDEGDQFNIDISQYVTGAPTGYRLNSIRATNSDAPNIGIGGADGIHINRMGIIYGTGDLESAPNVMKDEVYTISIQIFGDPITQTDAVRAMKLTIRQLGPEWDQIPPQDEDEGNPWSLDLSDYVMHEPDNYSINSVTPTRTTGTPDPPALQFNINNDGVISHEELPNVLQDETYNVSVAGMNDAGCDTGIFLFTINQVVPEWKDIPQQTVAEEEDLILNLTAFVDNEPDTFIIVSTTKGRTEAPDLSLSVGATTGLIQQTMPKVSQTETYTVIARCSNSAGTADPDATFTLQVLNTLPEWRDLPAIRMNENTTRSVLLANYIIDIEGVTYSAGPARLTNSGSFSTTPTLGVSDPTTAGQITLTASAVSDTADALFNVPVTAHNDVGSRSATMGVTVINTLTQPDFNSCSDQTFNENYTFSFGINASSSGTITYSKVSGNAFANVNSTTGAVTGTTPEVTGTIASNPSDPYPFVFRATATASDGTTTTADCSLTITVLNTGTPPPPGTAPEWSIIPDRNYREKFIFSFNIGDSRYRESISPNW